MPPRFPLAVRSGVPGIWPAALLSLALGACQPAQDATSPELAATKVNRTLTVTGGGTGGGVTLRDIVER